ncbi:hypothetical protein D3C77_755100 [compost metagenome]
MGDDHPPNIGQLLEQKAALSVQVHIIGWKAPFNSAGFAGEANLPGKGPAVKHRAGQNASNEGYRTAADRAHAQGHAAPPGA